MAFGRRTPQTLADKLAGVSATKEAALSVFVTAANDLEAVADEADLVQQTADSEAEYLDQLAYSARQEATEARTKAALIRESFLGA